MNKQHIYKQPKKIQQITTTRKITINKNSKNNKKKESVKYNKDENNKIKQVKHKTKTKQT